MRGVPGEHDVSMLLLGAGLLVRCRALPALHLRTSSLAAHGRRVLPSPWRTVIFRVPLQRRRSRRLPAPLLTRRDGGRRGSERVRNGQRRLRPGHVRGISPGSRRRRVPSGAGCSRAASSASGPTATAPPRPARRRGRPAGSGCAARPPCPQPQPPLPPRHRRASARRIPHQGPRRQARRQHEREPDRAHRDHLPGAAGRRRSRRKAARAQRRRSRRPAKPGKISFTHLIALRAGAGHQAASGHGPHAAGPRRARRTGSRPRASRSVSRSTCSERTAAAASSCR